jgi:RNA polymerase sigma-70 factor (ECF subfamily)
MVHDDRTSVIQGWLDRLKAGDASAFEGLFATASQRLTRLARRMLRRYPGVHRWELTDDVLQNALIRLDRALRAVTPPTAKDFFHLAATQIRRELIDLGRHYYGPTGPGANHKSRGGLDGDVEIDPLAESTNEPYRLACWTEFHERIEGLPDPERELFDLLWYQGLTQAEAGAILGVSERTVNTRWVKARLKLHEELGGELPS